MEKKPSAGVPTPTQEELVRFDRKRKKKTSTKEWVNPHDPDAKITKLKDGRTRLGHKVEEAVDLETGAVLAVTAPEKLGDPQTMGETLQMARAEVKAVGSGAEVREVVAHKGYHSNETVLELKELGIRGYLSETDRGRRNWKGKNRKYQAPVYANRRWIRGRRGRRLQRRRSELVERPFAHQARHGRVAPHLRPGPHQCPKAIADPRVWIQPGTADAASDGGRDTPESAGPRLSMSFSAFLDENGPLDRSKSALGALLGVDPARFAVWGSSNPSINHLRVGSQKEQ